MKTSLKSVLCLMLVFAFILSFTACGNSTTNNENSTVAASTAANTAEVSTEKPKEVKTLKITMAVDWYLKGWQAVEKDVNDNADKLGFKLDLDKIAGGDQGVQIIQTRAAAMDFPDILLATGLTLLDTGYHIADKLVDLTGSDWTKNYDTSFLSGSNYTLESDGKLYGAPFGGTNIPGVFYNKKVFSDLNLSVPSTWNEFLTLCEKVKAAGKTPLFMAGKDTWTVQIFNIMGMQRELKGKDANQLNQFAKDIDENKLNIVNLPLFKDSYVKLKELKDKGYFQKNWLSDGYDAQQKAITDGSAAMIINATWILSEIEKKYADKLNDIGAFTIPFDGDDPIGAWTPYALFAINTSKNIDAAKAFVNYFETVETQNKYFGAQPGISVMKGLTVDGIAPAAQDLYTLFTTPGRGQLNWQSLGFKVKVDKNFPIYSMMVLVNGKTPDQALEDMRKEIEKDAKAKAFAGW